MEISLEELLPPWAIGLANGKLVKGAQLSTRDGRKTGNAHIVAVREPDFMLTKTYYQILTDAGNGMCLSEGEVLNYFHPPVYISDVAEVYAKFSRRV